MKVSLNQQPLRLNSKFILIISMLYLTASLTADAVSYKFWAFGSLIESGASIIFPLTYNIGDIMTEVYGYSMARRIIWFSLGCELLFALILEGIIRLPSPAHFPFQNEYKDIFSPLLWFVVSGVIADLASSFVNIYAISKFKIFMRGRNFIVRSIASTAIAETLMNIIICFLAFFTVTSFKTVLQITLSAYLLQLFYALIFALPSWLIIIILKRHEHQDAYDYNVNYNIFRLN